MILLELLVTGAALLFPIIAIAAILTGKRTAGLVSLVVGVVAVFLYGFGMGLHSQTRVADRCFNEKIKKPLHLTFAHMQELSTQGRTNDLNCVLKTLTECDLRLFSDPRKPQPEFVDIVGDLIEKQNTLDANKGKERIR